MNETSVQRAFDEFYRAAIDALPFTSTDRIRVLDLGAGTGLLSFYLGSAFPNAAVTLVDVSAGMLAQARERLEIGGNRFRFEIADFAENPIDEKYEVIVSGL